MGALAARQKTEMYLFTLKDWEREGSDEGTGGV